MARATVEATPAERLRARLRSAFRQEEREGLRLAMRARLVALAAIALWLPIQLPLSEAAYFIALVAVFAVLAAALLGLSSSALYRPWMKYAFVLIEACLITYTLLVPSPVGPEPLPAAMTLRLGNFPYLFVFLASAVLTTSPALVIWSGVTMAAAWGAGVAWIVSLPGTVAGRNYDVQAATPLADRLAVYLDPHYVDIDAAIANIVVLLIVTGTLAAAVARARAVARRQARAERERANLARHFSPNVVDELANSPDLLGGPARSQPVAVLFADIVGFTRLCAGMAPDEVIDLLRAFHRLSERAVFDHGGTLDKYIGDGLMATFGTPSPSEHDGTSALLCARALIGATAAWSREREAHGLAPVRLSVGAHYGPVLLGEVGGEHMLEFTVTGDTVNVASRLEALTRVLDVAIVISDDLAQRALAEGGADALVGFHPASPQLLRGRTEPLAVWVLRLDEAQGAGTPAHAAGR